MFVSRKKNSLFHFSLSYRFGLFAIVREISAFERVTVENECLQGKLVLNEKQREDSEAEWIEPRLGPSHYRPTFVSGHVLDGVILWPISAI